MRGTMERGGTSVRAAPAGALATTGHTALYTKLKPRPNGPGRERVARHQRARLHGATVEAAAARGYPAITVSELAALAGVSRRTFYEHFADRDACFLASYDAIVGGAARRAQESWGGGRGGAVDVERAFATLAAEIAREPKAARLAVVEILAAGQAGRERAERTRAALERALARVLVQPDGAPPPPDVVRGIAGGLWLVTRRRVLEGSPQELAEHAAELLRWAQACASPAAAELPTGAPTVASIASAGTHGHDDRADDPRRLILRAAAELAAREGYERATTARVAHEAGVPESLLIERHGTSEECFLAALELLTAQALAAALRDAQGSDWPAGVQRAIGTLMRHIAHDGAFARIAFVEVFAAGPAGIQRGEGLLRGLSDLLTRYAPRSQRPSPVAAEAAVGAIWEMIRHHVAHRTTRRLPELAGCATYMVLAPTIGAQEAVRVVRAGS
jgi:AcrR family transcriptional regulator